MDYGFQIVGGRGGTKNKKRGFDVVALSLCGCVKSWLHMPLMLPYDGLWIPNSGRTRRNKDQETRI
jgi:hypothetical protein